MANEHLDVDGLQKLLWGFASHRVITVAGRTGILRRLADAPETVDEVARELQLDPVAAGKVVRAITALGLVEAAGDRYRVVPPLRRHFREGADDLAPFLEHSHGMYDSWGANLERWLRGDQWGTMTFDADRVRRFGAAMQAMGSHVAEIVAARLDLTGVRRVLDVGGGFGHFARALCRSAEGVRATVLDVQEAVDIARSEVPDTDLGGRVNFVAGDYLTSDYGSGFDLVLLANVLHQELPEAAAEMVRHSAAALTPGGRVAVVDFSIDDDRRESVLGALFAVNMRSFGDTHTFSTIRLWMEAAGLREVYRVELNDHRWLIVGRSPVAEDDG